MRKQLIILISSFLAVGTGCTKDFVIDSAQTKPVYTIEGRISNLQGPYYVRITKASNSIGPDPAPLSGLDNAEAVEGAEVIITDDTGLADTLKPIDQSDPRYTPPFLAERGYYGTNRLTGVPGHTYRLQVRIDNEIFQASATMPDDVPAIDSVQFRKEKITDPPGFNEGAFAYFNELQHEENYYVLQVNFASDSLQDMARYHFGASSIFQFVAFDDKTLPAYVGGMAVQAVLNQVGFDGYKTYWIAPFDPVQVRLFALTNETYAYFKALEKQFVNDGDAYKPAPASAPGNISGAALGFFWATNISGKVIPR